MPKRLKKRTGKSPSTELLKRIEQFFNQVAPDLIVRLTSAESRATQAETQLAWLNTRLEQLLNRQQIEAARISGTTPAVYAIEYLELWKATFFPQYVPEIRSLAELRNNPERGTGTV